MPFVALEETPQTETRKRVCPNCGKEFYSTAKWHYSMKRDIYCSTLCKSAWNDREAQRLIDTGLPFVDVSDVLRCNLCGAILKVIGTHFKLTHGFDVGHKMSKSERQLYFNVRKGTRFATPEMREIYREHALKLHRTGVLVAPKGNENVKNPNREFARMVPLSEKQITMFMNGPMQAGAYATHVKGCVTSICEKCGKSWTHLKSKPGVRFCSRACYLESKRATIICRTCGREFTEPKCYENELKNCPDCRKSIVAERKEA